jgi:tetratricopeptide (TPR) repeat protein
MKKILFLFLLAPIISFGQNNYSFSSKKAFKDAELLMTEGKLDDALVVLNQLVGIEPKFSEAYLNISKIEFAKGNFENALKFGKMALNYNNVQHTIYTTVGEAYFMLSDYDSSSYYFELANLYGANTGNDFLLLAKSENNQNDYDNALGYIEKAILFDDVRAEYYAVRGNSYLGKLSYEKAKIDFEKSLELNPNQNLLFAYLAEINIENNNLNEALKNINKGMEMASGNEKVKFLNLKGYYFYETNDIDSSEKVFSDAYALDDENTTTLLNQAAIMIKKGDYENAVKKCSKAIDIDGTHSEAYFNRGIAYEMLRKTEEACSDWEEAFIMGSVKAEEFINSPTCNE